MPTAVEEIRDALEARAAGGPEALDPWWASESTSWRSYDGREVVMTNTQRRELARAEWRLFRAAMPDFEWASELHVSFDSCVVELAAWSGTALDGELRVDACLVYRIQDGRIERIDMYVDGQQMARLQAVISTARASA